MKQTLSLPQRNAEPADDGRLTREADPAGERGDRGVEDTERSQDLALFSEDELNKFIASEFEDSRLPSPPKIPGWHLCWLTTTSPYDPVQKRMRLGYVPVRPDELPGFQDPHAPKLEGFSEGYITCNEMVLFKIKEEVYQGIMRYFHHKRPLEQEEGALAQLKGGGKQNEAGFRMATEGDGVQAMDEDVRLARSATPVF